MDIAIRADEAKVRDRYDGRVIIGVESDKHTTILLFSGNKNIPFQNDAQILVYRFSDTITLKEK